MDITLSHLTGKKGNMWWWCKVKAFFLVGSVDIPLSDESTHVPSKQVNGKRWRGYTVKGKMWKEEAVRSEGYNYGYKLCGEAVYI